MFVAQRTTSILLAILVLGAALRFVPIWFGLDYPASRPDEEVAIATATRMQDGDLNPRFFHWPSLTFYVFAGLFELASLVRRLLSPGSALTVPERVLLARALVALAGTLTIAVLYSIGRRIAGPPVGLLAALFLAVAILHMRDSHFAMTDVLATLLVVASLALLLRGMDVAIQGPHDGERPWRWFAAAGLAAGLATSTKYHAAALGGPMAVAQLLLLAESRKLLRARHVTPLIVFGAAMIAGFVLASPYVILDFERFESDLRFNFTHLSDGHGVSLGRGWTYHIVRSLPYGVGVPTFIAAIGGIVPMARHYRRHALVLAGFATPFYVAIGSGTTVFFRYIIPLVPIVCLLAAVGVVHGAAWAAARTRVSSLKATAVLAALITIPALVNGVWFDLLLARTDSRVLAAEWLVPRLEPGHTLYDSGGHYSALDLRRARFHQWFFDPVANSFGDPAGRTPDWLVLTESPVRFYASIPPQLHVLVQEKYELVHAVPATKGRVRAAVYDLQDAFFLPLSRFDTVIRPGPNILIYRRRGP